MVTEEFTPVKKQKHFRVFQVILVHAFERFETYYNRCSELPKVPASQANK